jgi:hypothetical protein
MTSSVQRRAARQGNAKPLPRRWAPAWPVLPALRMLRLVAGALALAMVLSIAVQAQAARRLTELVDSSWRGSYDLIVSASVPSSPDLTAPLVHAMVQRSVRLGED